MGVFDVFRRKLSADDFAALVIKRAHAMAHITGARYDAKAFQISFELDDGPLLMNLHNAFRDTVAAPLRERNRVIDTYLSGMASRSQHMATEEALPRLMPVIRDTAMFAWVKLTAKLSGDDTPPGMPCLRAFPADLSIALVLDSEHATTSVGENSLIAWGIDEESAFSRALANLRERTSDDGMQRQGGIWVSSWRDVFDASRLLLTDMIHRLPVRGEPVAVIPSRNHLFLTGSLDDEGIARIAALAVEVLENDTRPLSGQLLKLRDGVWLPFHASLPVDTARRLNLVRYRGLLATYAEQKAQLEKILEKEGRDIFVATYNAAEHKDSGRIVSTAQWTRDVATLLPQCDQLRLYCDHRNEMLDIEWSDAVALIPELAAPYEDLAPPRFFLSGFPDDASYDELRGKAVRITAIHPE